MNIGWRLMLVWLGMRHDTTHVRILHVHAGVVGREKRRSSQALAELGGQLKLLEIGGPGDMVLLGRRRFVSGDLAMVLLLRVDLRRVVLVMLLLVLLRLVMLLMRLIASAGMVEGAGIKSLRARRRIRHVVGLFRLALTPRTHSCWETTQARPVRVVNAAP